MTATFSRRALLRGLTIGAPALALSAGAAGADVLDAGHWLAYRVQRLVGGDALAPEFTESELSPVFRINGNTMPTSPSYQKMAEENFVNWRLRVDGLVVKPQEFTLTVLKGMLSRTQITLHNCVEGWSAIGKWKGVQLSQLLNSAMLTPQARYVVFHCADDFNGAPYYESIDLHDAFHPQTILAYEMNDAPLTVGHGAPIRLRVERQLGYKQAKYVMRMEVVSSLAAIGRGKGGFWEDEVDYDWYAGI
jgi:DMSO/TMAO reductase YedYZ molybdopterin-dependent catalytic subunit